MNSSLPIRMLVMPLVVIWALAVVLGDADTAMAQVETGKLTNYVPEGEIESSGGDKAGIDGTLAVGANASVSSNDHVVGQVDGFSTLLGFSLVGGLDYVYAEHEFRNTLKLTQAWAKTPVVNAFVKANDVLDIEALYNYFLLSWVGPFARLNLQSSILPADDLHASPISYAITRANGLTELPEPKTKLRLAGAFEPLTLNESVGAFTEPIKSDPFSLSVRIGFGARETFADGVLVVSDDEATADVIEVTELSDVYQGGVELFVGVGGALNGKRITYNAGGTVLVPFLNNDPAHRSATDLTRMGMLASVTFSLYKWMGINYSLKVLDDPQLLDEIQVQNNLLLTFNYTLVERNVGLEKIKAPEPKPDAEKKRADEAEARAKHLEAEATELRKALEAAEKKKVEEPPVAEPEKPEEKTTPEPASEP